MAWYMAPVENASLRLKEGERAGGANLQWVQWGLVLQVSIAVRLLWIGGVPVASDSTPKQWLWGWVKSAGSSLGVCFGETCHTIPKTT